MKVVIRDFQYKDVAGLVHLSRVAFADELRIQGSSSEGFINQLQLVTRGRMIPIRALARIMGVKWGAFVAEVDGEIVGFATCFGRGSTASFGNLMVAPDQRRKGIGAALLEKRLAHAKAQGFATASTVVLANNTASLGNVRKQGFEPVDQYSIFEIALPVPMDGPVENKIDSAPVLAADKEVFTSLEKQLYGSDTESAWSSYFPGIGDKLFGRFSSQLNYARTFRREGELIGFLAAFTSKGQSQTSGTLVRPVVSPTHMTCLPLLINNVGGWLSSLGKATLRISLSDDRTELITHLTTGGWQKRATFLQLEKKL